MIGWLRPTASDPFEEIRPEIDFLARRLYSSDEFYVAQESRRSKTSVECNP